MAFKPMGGGGGKTEWVSSHKLSLLVLVRELCNSDEECMQRCRHGLHLLLIELLQAPDMEITQLCRRLKMIDQDLHRLLMTRLEEMVNDGLSGLVDFFQSLDDLFTGKEPALQKASLFGLYTRRMSLLFHKMTFSQVASFYTLFEKYFSHAKIQSSDSDDEGLDESMESARDSSDAQCKPDSEFVSKMSSSSRQAEFFLANQASAIQSGRGDALSPLELQTKISQLLSMLPDISEAHYVSYLNCLRVGEFKQAVDNLYHYFDKEQWDGSAKIASDNTDGGDEKCRSFRYAALNLAALHCRLGHRQEALSALKEAIQMAQETNDHVCLEHCLLWLYRLQQEGSTQASVLLDRFVARASELKLPYLTSLSMLTHTRHDALAGMPPPKVLQALSHITTINSQHWLQDMSETTLAQQAAVWQCYGKSHVSSMFSQLLLNRSARQQLTPAPSCNPTSGDSHLDVQNGEATCLSLCNLARGHNDKGMFNEAAEILEFCKKTFPRPSDLSKIWMLTEAILLHDKALNRGDMEEAERAVSKMTALDNMQAKYRSALNMIQKGNFAEARTLLQQVLEYCRKKKSLNDGQNSAAELQSNVLLALSQLYFMSGNPLSALPHLLDCLTLSCAHYLDHCAAMASLMIGHLQLSLGLPGKALVIVKSSMVQILSHGSLYTQCCAQFLLVKCQLAANCSQDSKDKRKSAILSALSTLDHVLQGFRKLQASQKICQVLYYQARVYEELGYTAERNRCSAECCQLLQQPLAKHTAGSALCCI